jgi:uncharacterized membrane protein YeaQ/YmgE (transglycosylase-associated protein family)
VTLVAETLGKNERGYGTAVVAALGLLGAVAASLVGQLLPWKFAYLVGGELGFLLLHARFKLSDSQLFKNLHATSSRGDLLSGLLSQYLQSRKKAIMVSLFRRPCLA